MLRARLQRMRKKIGVPWNIIEKDYLLSWVLVGISQEENLGLIFKGGTALKKCFFGGNYRFSEDLDFTAVDPAHPTFDHQIQSAVKRAESLLNQYDFCRLFCTPYTEKKPHPEDQEAYVIRAQFSWHREPLSRVCIEITRQEHLCFAAVQRPIFHEYGEKVEASLPVYSLEEIVIEKLRSILQNTKKLHEREWTRSRARDYYDIWRILNTYPDVMQNQNVTAHLRNKCKSKNVSFSSSASFFDNKMLSYIQETWKQWLGDLTPNLPSSSAVLEDLRAKLGRMIASGRR